MSKEELIKAVKKGSATVANQEIIEFERQIWNKAVYEAAAIVGRNAPDVKPDDILRLAK